MARKTDNAEIERLKSRLREAEETLEALRFGKVDAVVVDGPSGPQIYTLRTADHTYRILVEQMHEAALAVSQAGTILYANQRFAEMVGSALDAVIGHELISYVAERCRPDVWSVLGSLPSRAEAYICCPSREIPVSLAASSMRIADSDCVALVMTDLTEQKARDAAMNTERAARYALEEANRAKDAFLITVSHELRTPLTSILGWATLLNSSDVDDATRRLGMTSIERSTRMQAELIDDLLDVSRIVTGKVRMSTEPVEIRTSIEAALAAVRGTAEGKHIRLGMTCQADLPAVRGDGTRLQQVFWNLLSNALKFTPEGGRIDVDVSAEPPYVRIDVRDTGCGISAEFLPRIFERFSQENTSSTRPYAGLGLGLSVARDLVQFHGGSITASSMGIGRGSTFSVTLPMFGVEAEAAANVVRMDVGRSILEGLSVLTVDDDDATRAWLSHTLQLFGARVSSASSVSEALESFDREPPDVVISDLAMPVDDGLSLVSNLRVRVAGRKVPTIALTAFGRPEDRDRLLSAGFDEYLRKPIDASRLVRAVFEAKRRSEARA